MIYDPAILSREKGPRRTMGSKMGGHRGRRHTERLYSYRKFKLGHPAHR